MYEIRTETYEGDVEIVTLPSRQEVFDYITSLDSMQSIEINGEPAPEDMYGWLVSVNRGQGIGGKAPAVGHIDYRLEGRRSYDDYTNPAMAWEAWKIAHPDTTASQENEADFRRGWNDASATESGGDFITLDLREFGQYFQTAAEIARRYAQPETTVRWACQQGLVKAWRLGRDWIVYAPDAEARWGKR